MLFRKNSLLVVVLAAAAVLVGTAGVAQATLISYWALDEAGGATSALDTSGVYTNDLTPTVYGAGAIAPTPNHTGAIGSAWRFFGTLTTSSSLQRANVGNLTGMTDLTLSAWVYIGADAPTKLDGTGVTPGVIRNRSGSKDLYTLQCTNPLTGQFYAYPIAGRTGNMTVTRPHVASPGAAYPAGDYLAPGWCMETYTSVGSTGLQIIYRNGVAKANNNSSGAVGLSTAAVIALSGVAAFTGYSVTGYEDDAGVWDEALSATKVKTLYTAPTTFTTDATAGFYGQKDMQTLFGVYADPEHDLTALINGNTWQYMAASIGHVAGDAWISGGNYFVQLGADGSGVSTIPEPSTLLLLASGLVGLLCYAWRKRK